MRIFNVLSILVCVLFSTVVQAHEGHGTGVAHELHHALWLLAAVVTPLVVLGFYYLKDK